MGTVYRKSVTRPLPANAEIIVRKGERFARWNANGKNRVAPVTTGRDGAQRIVDTAGTFTAKFRDGAGIVRELATGCRDETAARRVLGDLERRAELVKAGVITGAEDSVSAHQATPLNGDRGHVAAYLDHLQAKGVHPTRLRNARGRLARLLAECGAVKLADLGAAATERWMTLAAAGGMSAPTRNEYRQELVSFGNWCVRTRRLPVNPFAVVARADARADCRRKRRSLTEAELVTLLDVARRRPLLDAMTVRRGRRKGEAVAKLRDDVRERLELLGRERALIYKTLVLTGLRRGELASITVGQLDLDGAMPSITLDVADEKNREGSTLPIRRDLAGDLSSWVKDLDQRNRGDSGAFDGRLRLPMAGVSLADKLPADTVLFDVPVALVKILDRDLAMAGIPKRDDRGRTVDVHALRHSFGTLLSKGGVAPRTAQAAMRHSTIDLTMNVYTDPRLLDVAGALDALPSLPLDGVPADWQEQRATGTDDLNVCAVAPTVAPNSDFSCTSESFAVKTVGVQRDGAAPADVDANRCGVKQKHPLTTAVSGCLEVERKGVEPSTFALRTRRSPN